MKRKLPVGIESFEEIHREGFYYVDKSYLIRDLLNSWGKVNLFTRPRRFGKTLNMSMLKCFFELGADKSLFDGLAIAKETELCEKYMGKFPVVFISLKSVEGLDFEKSSFIHLVKGSASTAEHQDSLKLFSRVLFRIYGQKAIILIDEYEVPLDKAFSHGYYDEMVSLIRGLFGQALKTNEFLYFAVLTGCLRVSRESIFTGLDNFDVNSIVDVRHDEQFGFTEREVDDLLESYGLEQAAAVIKE